MDVEDKIINKANERISWEEVVRRYTTPSTSARDARRRPPRRGAARHRAHTGDDLLIQELIERATPTLPLGANGDVHYDVESFPSYGKLSHQRPEEMRETESAT